MSTAKNTDQSPGTGIDVTTLPGPLLLEDSVTGLSLRVHEGIALVAYDQPASPVNTLNTRIAPTFEQIFTRIDQDASIVGAVLVSGKTDNWIAGADIDELQRVTSAADGERLSRSGQLLLDRLAGMSKPVVAALHGATLGGGLEVALACRHRIATEHPKTVLAFPEVQLGLIPGAGGTQRLPRTVGLQVALDLILTGKNVRARKAWQIGLVHELVHPAILLDVAMRRARQLAHGDRSAVRERHHGIAESLLEENAVGRAIVFRKARESVMKKTRGHYPAPLAALDVIEKGYQDTFAAGLLEEARRFGQLAVSPECRQLVYLFFATTALKKDTGLPPGTPAIPRPVHKLGVLGAGFMGAGIASVAVQAGTLVRLKDGSLERLAAGVRAVREVVRERLKKRQITRTQFDDTMSLVGGTLTYQGFANTDLVIEAVFEDIDVKHQVLRESEQVAPSAIFASNTSTIPIHEIARVASHPERVLGMHFFSPVHRMPLLEVIVTPQTGAEATATAVAYGKQIGKTVIVVQDGAGFYVNRILAPYLNECGRMVDEGASIEAVDKALVEFGFPVGPFTLLDEVGLDIAGKSGPIMEAAFGPRMQPSATLRAVIASGRLGRKARKGFYRYDSDGKRQGVDETIYALTPAGPRRRTLTTEEMQQRAVLPLLNEAVRCLDEGIIRSPRDGDIGAVFGIGFPPFRGGPFRMLDTLGLAEVVTQLDALQGRFPGRFEVAKLLRARADRQHPFHP